MRGEVGKETPKKEMDVDVFFMISHMTLSSTSGIGGSWLKLKHLYVKQNTKQLCYQKKTREKI